MKNIINIIAATVTVAIALVGTLNTNTSGLVVFEDSESQNSFLKTGLSKDILSKDILSKDDVL